MMAKARSESVREKTMENLLSESEKVREIMKNIKARMRRTTEEEIVAGLIEQNVQEKIDDMSLTVQPDTVRAKLYTYFDTTWSLLQQIRLNSLAGLDSGTITEDQFEIRIAATAKVWEERLKDGIKRFGADLVGEVINANQNIS